MTKQKKGDRIRYQRVGLSVRYDSILFPFDAQQLFRVLPQHGYVLDAEVAAAPLGVNVSYSGNVARKGDVRLRMVAERNVVGIDGATPDIVADEFTQIEQILADDLDYGLDASVEFYEVLAQAVLPSEFSPLAAFAQASANFPFLNEITEVVGEPVSLFGVRFHVRGTEPNSPNWLEFRIEPSITRPNKQAFISVVWRTEDRTRALENLKGMDDKIRCLLSALERQVTR